jgi:hypothetical protein
VRACALLMFTRSPPNAALPPLPLDQGAPAEWAEGLRRFQAAAFALSTLQPCSLAPAQPSRQSSGEQLRWLRCCCAAVLLWCMLCGWQGWRRLARCRWQVAAAQPVTGTVRRHRSIAASQHAVCSMQSPAHLQRLHVGVLSFVQFNTSRLPTRVFFRSFSLTPQHFQHQHSRPQDALSAQAVKKKCMKRAARSAQPRGAGPRTNAIEGGKG